MPTIALISDIHANRAALAAAFEVIAREGYERIVCLGDLVGYGPDPGWCLEEVRRRAATVILGNHDEMIGSDQEPLWFNPHARRAVVWSREQLTPEQRAWLRGLPTRVEHPAGADQPPAVFAHGNLVDYFQSYIITAADAEASFDRLPDGGLAFIGHTHTPLFFVRDAVGAAVLSAREEWVPLPADGKLIVNLGSVGQPRDGDPRASFLGWDPATRRVRWHRVDYDYRDTQARMRAAELPEFLIERLAVGR